MWQQIAIIIIGILALTFVGYRIYNIIKAAKEKNNPCIGCTGCNLYNQIKSKKDCPENKE